MKVYKAVFILSFAVVSIAANAQFQRKFTIDLGISPLFPSKGALREDRIPYLFSNFQYGYGSYTNILYNHSRKFSAGLALTLSSFRSWKDPRTTGETQDESYFNIYSLNPNIKYKIITKGKFSPFVMIGGGLSVYHSKRAQSTVRIDKFYPVDFNNQEVTYVSIDQVLIREPGFEIKPKSAFNALGAVGLDVKLSESLGLTLMACYNTSFTSGNFTLDQNLKYFSFPIGINLNLGKSKTL